MKALAELMGEIIDTGGGYITIIEPTSEELSAELTNQLYSDIADDKTYEMFEELFTTEKELIDFVVNMKQNYYPSYNIPPLRIAGNSTKEQK